MKEIFQKSYENYVEQMRKVIPDYDNSGGHENRRKQCRTVIEAINDNFKFDRIITLETGASSSYDDGLFGLFLGYVTLETGGKMISVDISSEIATKSKEIFNDVLPNLEYEVYAEDSVSFLKRFDEVPNLVHLDSWNFDLFDAFPSALHGWEEFKAIESKMLPGSIIIVDDNYRQNTIVQWIYSDGNQNSMVIPYPMVGKGAHVYQHALNENSSWKLIGTHYDTFDNIKIIIQKK